MEMKKLYVVQTDDKNEHELYFNDVLIGHFCMNTDGFWVFFVQKDRHGYWESRVLRLVADALDEINKPWLRHIDEMSLVEDALNRANKCTVCHVNYVDTENGYDTCDDCLKRQ
jgi:hypothetical protein